MRVASADNRVEARKSNDVCARLIVQKIDFAHGHDHTILDDNILINNCSRAHH